MRPNLKITLVELIEFSKQLKSGELNPLDLLDDNRRDRTSHEDTFDFRITGTQAPLPASDRTTEIWDLLDEDDEA